ncbi:hairy and enhancer of split related-7 [Gadus macrocephalus]|uniref:hairy and enhancer of split related-7 n=1 Tax=Gadus macrocephalus TaxID=80720 RepID=UPI0028CB9A32|nr:hairy and enhancer of split related-7 [Gadus macrocephalus]
MEDATNDKKFFKSQMERRRRERMNRSLEHLRSLLLQGPQEQCGDQRRAEKAEVLEHTVLFLRSSEGARRRDGGTAGCNSFRDGFSACLERATRILGPQGKGLPKAVNFDTTLAVRLSSSDYAGLEAISSITKQYKISSKSVRRPRQPRTSSSALQARGISLHPKPCPVRHERSARVGEQTNGAVPAQERTQQRPATTVSPAPSLSSFQSLWRPWP